MPGELQEVFFDHEGQSAVFLELSGSRCAILINISRQMPYNRFWYLQFPNSDDFMYLLRRCKYLFLLQSFELKNLFFKQYFQKVLIKLLLT